MSFDFGSAEAWEYQDRPALLPVGSHVCTIISAVASHTSGKMGREPKPQIELTVQGELGERRDWIVITPNTVGKVVQVYDACGAERPREGEYNPVTGELVQECVDRLQGRRVGVIVRLEDSLRNPGTQEPRIGGYVEPQQITDDMPADTTGLGQTDDEKVPF
jgi:hypothetical protein